jgi:hypothetical protein
MTEGWKTNSGWKINSKIVVPYGVSWDDYGWSMSWGSNYRSFFNDLDEVLSWISETPLTESKGLCAIVSECRRSLHPGVWNETRFYDFKLFKKGTIHIRFTDQYLLDDLNAISAKGKNWLAGDGF